MSTLIERFNKIKSNIELVNTPQKVNIIAVSKTFPLEHISPLLEHGHNILVKIKFKRRLLNGLKLKKKIKKYKTTYGWKTSK